jgi:hypothetical protein
VRSAAIAEEIVLDVFLHIWKIRQELPGITHLTTYLFTCVRNRALNHLRRKKLPVYAVDESIFEVATTSPDPENTYIAILIVYSFEDAKEVYSISKDIMMEVMVSDAEKLRAFDNTGVSWSNVVAFVTHTQPTDPNIFSMIHEKGAMCIVGSSRTIDKAFTAAGDKDIDGLRQGYHRIINEGADIIEADLGIEAGTTLMNIKNGSSSKRSYFMHN